MTRRKELAALRGTLAPTRAIGRSVEVVVEPTRTRRPPRQLDGKRMVKIRIVADCEEEAYEARELVERLLAQIECRLDKPKEGSSPKYADEQKWMTYGDFVLPGKRKRR